MQEKNIQKPILINKFNPEIDDELLMFSQPKENKINDFLNSPKFNHLS